MAKRISFTPKKTPDGTWRLNVPGKLTLTGKRERHFFRTRELALAAAAKLKNENAEFGTQARAIPPSLAEAAVTSANLLEPWDATLVEAVRFYVAHRERAAASSQVDTAVDLWMESCADLRGKTVLGYRQSAVRLKAAFGAAPLSGITAQELQAALAPEGTLSSVAIGRIRAGKTFWRWASRRGWCQAEVADRMEPPKRADSGEIEFLTVEEVRALLRAAMNHFPQAVGSYVLQLFAGIRAEEITRLDESNVTADGIEMTAETTKKGRRRHINPSPTLKAWLAAFPFAPCPNWARVDRAVRRLAGWEVEAVLLKNQPDPHRGRWPQNALRHSFASYAIAAGVPLESMLFEFGHVGTPALLRQHYAGRASKKTALEFFAIRPPGAQAIERLEVVA